MKKNLTNKQELVNRIVALDEQFSACGTKWEHKAITPRTTVAVLTSILDDGNKLLDSVMKTESPWDRLIARLCREYAQNKGENGHLHLFFKGQYVANNDYMVLTKDLKDATLRVVKSYKTYNPSSDEDKVFYQCMDELVKRGILNKVLHKGNIYYRATDTQLQRMKEF